MDMKKMVATLLEAERPPLRDIEQLCSKVTELLAQESNVLEVSPPMTIVGDIHGQFFDLKEIFNVCGQVPQTSYLFMGDYVDRGHYSVETVLLLFALKVLYPSRIFLLRGNHETRQITQVYGFYDECLNKFRSPEVWRWCTDAFDHLALAALVGAPPKRLFAVHAGLSPSIKNWEQINHYEFDRVKEVPHEGAMCDLLWSDPELDVTGWGISPRGAGYIFGDEIVKKFCRDNSVKQICRSHQLVMDGYKGMFPDKQGNKQLVTIWSAPNYCYRCANDASVLSLDENMESTWQLFGPCFDSMREKPDPQHPESMAPDYFL